MTKTIITVILLFAALFALTGCGGSAQALPTTSTSTAPNQDIIVHSGGCNLDTMQCIGEDDINDAVTGNRKAYHAWHTIQGPTTLEVKCEIGINVLPDPTEAYCVAPVANPNYSVVGIIGGSLTYNAFTANFSSMSVTMYNHCCDKTSEVLSGGKLQAQGKKNADGTVTPGITTIAILADPQNVIRFAAPKAGGSSVTISYNSDLKEAHPDTISYDVIFEIQEDSEPQQSI